MDTFKPHGLIKSEAQELLYNTAHFRRITKDMDPREYHTVALMAAILYQNIFTDRRFIVAPEQPPEESSKKRCDIVIKYLEQGGLTFKALCFAECKRTNKTHTFSLAALEEQAFGYCKQYLKSEPKVSFVYAATMAGAHVKAWKVTKQDGAFPIWGRSDPGDWNDYKDVGHPVEGLEIEETFHLMMANAPTLLAGQNTTSNASASKSYSNQPSGGIVYVLANTNPSTAMSGYGSLAPAGVSGTVVDVKGKMKDNSDTEMARDDANEPFKVNVSTVTAGRKGHSAKYSFEDRNGAVRMTSKEEWKEATYYGESVWVYRGWETLYMCRFKDIEK